MSRTRRRFRPAPLCLWSAALLALAAGCGSSHDPGAIDGGVDGSVEDSGELDGASTDSSAADGAPGDAARDGDAPPLDAGPLPRVNDLDLLFMIDNSNSMTEEQASLARELPRLMDAIASGELRDGAGAVIRTFDPPTSIHVGVISSDMGTGGVPIPTCVDAAVGEDGILRTRGNGDPSCMRSYPGVQDFEASRGDDAGAFASDVACVANMGIGGCGFEQQLEAALKALTPSGSSVRFVDGSAGHADGENAGFVRDGSALAIISLTDDDDCSVSDPELFDPGSSSYPGDLNPRCVLYPEALHPTSRYIDGLLSLRDDPRRLVYAPIVGVPTDLVPGQRTNFARVLGDPRMEQRIDPASEFMYLVPSCDTPGRGLAFPPRRIVEVGRELESAGASVTVQSLCQSDFTKPINSIINAIADALGG